MRGALGIRIEPRDRIWITLIKRLILTCPDEESGTNLLSRPAKASELNVVGRDVRSLQEKRVVAVAGSLGFPAAAIALHMGGDRGLRNSSPDVTCLPGT